MSHSNNNPIGVFDSGVGGLSVFRQIRADLPDETLLYVADSGHAPYGNKPADFIVRRSFAITEFLLEQGAKAVVVACNTATAAAIARLRAQLDIPIIGIEPALKPAVAGTRSGVVGILATGNTVRSDKFAALLDRHRQHTRVLVQPCPGLADCVERGELSGPHPRTLLERYLEPLLTQGADTLVLGCTHYPFLIPLIQRLVGPNVVILDPSPAVAQQLRRRLEWGGLLAEDDTPAGERYFTSGPPEQTSPVMSRLLGYPVTLDVLPERYRNAGTLPTGLKPAPTAPPALDRVHWIE
ncbi:MAG: glutamate racemase [Candidatus Competibacteraceae bacterium]|nr:glutamate racemase [Candidatus Competibacteraceae bacterium]